MHRTLAILSSLAIAITAAGAMGCSSSSSGAPPAPNDGISCTTSSTVSFKNDIIPLFQLSCTLSAVCHGQMNNAAEENLYLGENAGGTNVDTVYKGLVGAAAVENPMQSLITAGSLENSFLWHKVHVDSSANFVDLNSSSLLNECAPTAMMSGACSNCGSPTYCGAGMPYLSVPLEDSQLCLLQNWILAGAQNN